MNTHTDTDPQDELRIAEKAAAWLSAVRYGGERERAAFAAWLKESPRHVEEALFASSVERELCNFDRERKIDIAQLLAEGGVNVVPWVRDETAKRAATLPMPRSERKDGAVRTPSNSRFKRWHWAAAAAVAALAIVGLWRPQAFGGWETYATTVGEQRSIELRDGSVMQLNTHSQVAVRFAANGRDIRLVRGEALFKVEHDPLRPFKVHARGAVIQAIGTQFNVYRRSEDTTVSVLEGAVQISEGKQIPARLAAGQEARIAPNGPITKQADKEVTQLAVWRQRRLVFNADTLDDIAAEFNRYNRTLQIRLEGDTIGGLRFTGVFDADDPLSLVQLLDKDRALAFAREDGKLIIRAR